MSPQQKKPQMGPITVAQAKRLVKRYAKMKGISPREAELALIASGYRRLAALRRHAQKAEKS